MIDESDINIYLRAKRQIKLEKIVTTCAIVMLLVWVVFRASGIDYLYFDAIAVGAFFGGISVNISGWFGSLYVSRAQLIKVIEGQINKDSAAIQYVLDKNT